MGTVTIPSTGKVVGAAGHTDDHNAIHQALAGAAPKTEVTVVSHLSPATAKAIADYVCDGVNDQVQINAAITEASRASDGFGGSGYMTVRLVGPTFNVGDNGTPILMLPQVHLRGAAINGTLIHPKFSSGYTGGAIELANSNVAHVCLSDFAVVGNEGSARFNGHGIRIQGAGQGSAYAMKSGNDPFCRVERVWVGFSGKSGLYLHGDTGGARESQVFHCVFWNCLERGLLIEGSSDSQISDCRANGGSGFARFEVGGGNTKIANCKAYYSGNAGTAAAGYLCNSSRVEIANCSAQDCGTYGFEFTSGDVSASALVADSNSRQSASGGGFRIAAGGIYSGLNAFDRNQTPDSRQLRGIVFEGSPQVHVQARISVPSGTSEIVGSPGANSYARVVRAGTTLYTTG